MEACLEKSSRISFWRQKLRYTFSMLDVYKKGVSLPVSAFQQCLCIYQIVLFWNFQPNASVLRRCKLWMLLTWGILSTCRVVSNAVWMVWDTHTQVSAPASISFLLADVHWWQGLKASTVGAGVRSHLPDPLLPTQFAFSEWPSPFADTSGLSGRGQSCSLHDHLHHDPLQGPLDHSYQPVSAWRCEKERGLPPMWFGDTQLSPRGMGWLEETVLVFILNVLFISAALSEVKPRVSADSFFLGSPR